MKCPVCNVDLLMAERQGIEIDYCPKCRGIWFDRGELDKIIERGAGSDHGSEKEPPSHEKYHSPHNSREDEEHDGGHYGKGKKKRSKFGMLGDLFDFGD
jgi:hypothetical protein